MASRLSLCVLIVLCVSQLADGAQSALELNGLDALALQKQRGAQFGKDVDTAVKLHLMDGTGEPPISEEPGTGSTETTLGSDPSAIPTSELPPDTSKAPVDDDPLKMTPLNIALVALCGIVLLVDIILVVIKCKKT